MMDIIKDIRAVLPSDIPFVRDVNGVGQHRATRDDLLSMGMVLIGQIPSTNELLFDCVRFSDAVLPGRVISDEGLRANRYQRAPALLRARLLRQRVLRRLGGGFIRSILDDLFGSQSTWAGLTDLQKTDVKQEAWRRYLQYRIGSDPSTITQDTVVEEFIPIGDINGGVVPLDDVVEPHQWL
jgi:hypothetical protein